MELDLLIQIYWVLNSGAGFTGKGDGVTLLRGETSAEICGMIDNGAEFGTIKQFLNQFKYTNGNEKINNIFGIMIQQFQCVVMSYNEIETSP